MNVTTFMPGELTNDSIESVKVAFDAKFPSPPEEVTLDLRGEYQDYLGIGGIARYALDSGVKNLTILSDVPLAREDSIIEMMCRGFPVEENEGSLRAQISATLRAHGWTINIVSFAADNQPASRIMLP